MCKRATVQHSPVSLQVYQLDTGHYLCRNKYYGRGLSIEGFREALFQFLHNGKGLRQDLFEPILNKLRSLKAVLEKQASYRFYSSSLLVIYEGQVRKEVASVSVGLPRGFSFALTLLRFGCCLEMNTDLNIFHFSFWPSHAQCFPVAKLQM